MAVAGDGPPEEPGGTAAQLRAFEEMLRRQRRVHGSVTRDGSGYGEEAGDDESEPSSTSSPEGEMPTLQDPAPKPYKRVTPRQYLVRERRAEYRSEYFDGDVVAMAGGTPRHARIAQNIASHLYFRLPDGCGVFQSDVKVQVAAGKGYAYPDVFVLCGPPQYLDRSRDVVTNPVVVFEVLSPGTEARDRTIKAAAYRQVPSLAAYVLVSQKEPRLEVYARGTGGAWECTVYQQLHDRVALDAIGCELTLAEVYRAALSEG